MLPIEYGPQHRRVPPGRFALVHDTVPAVVRRLLGLRPDTAVVLVGDGMFDVRFGRCRLCTPLTNLAEVATDPPGTGRSMIGARLTPDGHGLVIGTGPSTGEPAGAVRVRFRRPVSATGPAVVLRVSQVVVAAALPRDLAGALVAAMAVDARRPRGGSVHALDRDDRR